ncbi:bifunctional Gcp-like domain/tRNA N6-adenosine threonylcarbamoyltransferase Kae1 [Babesia duncani]|uniref:N(6)-L-threonylcarbamoyladenine synthase n=1 Tax=Babesia duncani TaxID=323732 RepID=A0AAD9PNZ1_9APIC|nr:bifunctional Gcp-like domain/tRNA N6-adenosine threonylcarbamoyltransferase Kae1 [Babesia duncani]
MTKLSPEQLQTFYSLGIEGSANKLGIGIVSGNGTILANVRRTYSAPDGEGFLPRHVAKHHRENVASLVKEALQVAGLELSQISQICYTKGPGVGSALHVGLLVAKTLHYLTGAPIVGVNHCVAHVEMGRFLSKYKRPVILYVSGGNTQVLCFDVKRRVYAVLGETLDVAVGNVLDRLARILKLPNKPAPGLSIEKQARQATGHLIPLPYVVKGIDCSLSGLLTKCEQLIQEAESNGSIDPEFVKDICFSAQEHAFGMLVEMTERAMAFAGEFYIDFVYLFLNVVFMALAWGYGGIFGVSSELAGPVCDANELLLVGGVGCNLRLQEMCEIMARERGAKLFPMDERYCIDNGAMIGKYIDG